VQLLWFLPSLAYGVMLAVSTGNYFLLVSTGLTLCVAIFVRYRIARRPKLSDKTQLRVIDKRIWLDDYRMPRSQILWTNEQAELIFDRLGKPAEASTGYADFIVRSEDLDAAHLQIALGFNMKTAVIKSLVDDGPHAVLIGRTGSGKTELLRSMLRTITTSNATCDLVCIDFKGGLGLAEFETTAQLFCSDQDLAHAEQVIQSLKQELAARELQQKSYGRLVIAVDELSHLLTSVKSSAEVLAAIAARGRSFKMHLVLTNQNLSGVSRALLSNIGLRILIGQPDPVDAAMLGSTSKSNEAAPVGAQLAQAQIVGHGAVAEVFAFALPGYSAEQPSREQKLAQLPEAREPRQRQRSTKRLRGYSSQARGRHRLRRQSAILGLLLPAHKAT
jgi:energy-coupling factor transporter ATP-binding protein EcfA2